MEMYKKKEMNLFGIMYSWFLAKVQFKCCSSPERFTCTFRSDWASLGKDAISMPSLTMFLPII